MSDPNTAPAGWYDDGTGGKRYWDGAAWTENTLPAAASGSPSAEQGDAATAAPAAPAAPAAAQTFAAAGGEPPTGGGKPHPLAWVALAVAVIGFIFACIPGALIVGWVLLPIAFVLSIVALFVKGARWPAITGLILSVLGTVVGFVVFFTVVSTSFDEAFGGTDSTVTQPSEDEEAEAVEGAPDAEPDDSDTGTRENPAAIGSVISGDEYDVTINSVTLNANDAVLAANQFNEAPPEGSAYAVINATITYTGEESGLAAMVGIDYVTATGEVITSTDTMAVAPEPALGLDELYTGGTVTGNTTLAIPVAADGLIRVRPGMIADEVFVSLQ